MTIGLDMVKKDNLLIERLNIFVFIFCKIRPLSARYID